MSIMLAEKGVSTEMCYVVSKIRLNFYGHQEIGGRGVKSALKVLIVARSENRCIGRAGKGLSLLRL